MVESGNQLKRMFLVSVVVTMMSLSEVLGLGEFQVVLHSFQNDRGLSSNATCCLGNASTQPQQPLSTMLVCQLECRTFFRICLSHYQANIPAEPQCTYGLTTTPVLGANTFNLSDANGTAYLVAFQFNFTWTGSFSLVIEAFHDLTSGTPYEGSKRKLILRVAASRLLSVGANWTTESVTDETTTGSTLVYDFRVVCQRNYFGAGCVRVCASRDDVFGHYDCDDEGLRVCKDGWTGSYCETAVCLQGCNDTFGLCITPFECRCRYGWQGRTCDECIRYPDCNHGNCILPWQCNCFDGWAGPLCNIDVRFCTLYQPCLNGGNCSDDAVINYTCQCPPGFRGRQCEIVDDICLGQRPCQNGAICKATNGTYVCGCPDGFSGVRCETRQTGSNSQSPQEATQEHQEVTTSEVLKTSHSDDESTYVPSTTPLSASSRGDTTSISSSELTWVELILIVCLGGLLPVLLIASGATIFAVHKYRRKRNETGARSDSSRAPPTASVPRLALPKMNNVEKKGGSRSASLERRDLTHQLKVHNVNYSTNLWSDVVDHSESKWTRRRLPIIGPPLPPEINLFSPAVQGRRCLETERRVDSVPDILGISESMTSRPWTQENVFIVPGQIAQRSQGTRPSLEYISVVASWRYEYPVGSFTTDV